MITVDANVVLPLLREDDLTNIARSVRARDPDWVVPSLLKIELANALLKEAKAALLSIELASQAITTAIELISESRVIDPPLPDVLVTAYRTGLTAYDAAYVVLARSLGVPLITEDKQILRACPDVACSMEQFLAGRTPPTAVKERKAKYRARKKPSHD